MTPSQEVEEPVTVIRTMLSRPGLRWSAAVTAVGSVACSWWVLGSASSAAARHRRRLRSLPYPHPGERVRAFETGPGPGWEYSRSAPRPGPEERFDTVRVRPGPPRSARGHRTPPSEGHIPELCAPTRCAPERRIPASPPRGTRPV